MSRWLKKTDLPTPAEALPGRQEEMAIRGTHVVTGRALLPPFPPACQQVMFGMGCFWGAEKRFWETPGVWTTAVGYAAGFTPNPTYEEVCSGLTGHNEVVLVVYDPDEVAFGSLLRTFWESHDPTQGMRQGNDVGTQYRSGIYVFDDEQRQQAAQTRDRYQQAIRPYRGGITTEILDAPPFYYAEDYHQQYLARNPRGYCGLGGTGVRLPDPAE